MGIEEALRKTILCDDLDKDQLKRVGQIAQRRIYDANVTIFNEGESGDALYIIEEGQIRITKSIGRGKEKTLAVLSNGNFFGEMAVLDQTPRSASARTITPAIIWSLSAERFNKVLTATDPQIAIRILYKLVKIFSQRLRDTNEEVIRMAQWALERRKGKRRPRSS